MEYYYKDKMSKREQSDCEDILDRLEEQNGRMFQFSRVLDDYVVGGDGSLMMVDFVLVRGNKYLVDKHGKVWRHFAMGTSKDPHSPRGKGAPYRTNCVEIATGQWKKLSRAGKFVGYFKRIITVSVDTNVNAHIGFANIDWYVQTKGFHHPLEGPKKPSAMEIAALEEKEAEIRPHIMAMEADEEEKAKDRVPQTDEALVRENAELRAKLAEQDLDKEDRKPEPEKETPQEVPQPEPTVPPANPPVTKPELPVKRGRTNRKKTVAAK